MIEANPAFKVLIYLASPYSGSEEEVKSRYAAVCDATARLLEAGHLVFSPIVHSHHLTDYVQRPDEWETWRDYDLSFIDKADELWILRLPGHTRSKGVHAELYHALDQGKRVRYINYPDLTEYAAVEACVVNAEGFPDVWEDEFKKEDYGKVNTWGNKEFPKGPVSDSERLLYYQPKTPTIIGLTGHAQSGKDTAGKYLVENHGFTRIGLADAVKECLYALDPAFASDSGGIYGRVRAYVDTWGWDDAKTIRDIRELLQKLGTEVGRNIISETIWLDIAKRKIDALGPDAKVVITDVRFPNEAEWVRSLGGQVVRIVRDGFGPVNDHVSDARLDDSLVDVDIENCGNLGWLYNKIDEQIIPYAAAA